MSSKRLSRRRTDVIVGLCWFAVAGGVDGCASSRLLKQPLPSAAIATTPVSTTDGIAVSVQALIVRNGGGSWLKNANWDEYVLKIVNESGDPCEIERISLESDKIARPVPSSTSREDLEARSNRALRALKDVGIVAGVGIVLPSALIVGAIGTSGGLLSASAGAAAVAAAGVIAIPVGLIGGTVYVVNRRQRDAADRVLIDEKIQERGFGLPLTLPAGAEHTASAFFPITPSPLRLIVAYSSGAEMREVTVDLPGLVGLHLKGTARPDVGGPDAVRPGAEPAAAS
jgi:hypothetical protein